ncbi:MAG: hypothetical protein ACT4TC_03820 [Myxococcaceae bacterium]
MPRTYRFDHFTLGDHQIDQRTSAEEKQHLHEGSNGSSSTGGGVRYGRRHAETEEILAARKMAAQLEQASDDDELNSDPGLKEMYKQLESLVESEPATPQADVTAHFEAQSARPQPPLGSLPGTEGPPPPSRLHEVLELAQTHARAVATSVRDFRSAATNLLTLPREVVKVIRGPSRSS